MATGDSDILNLPTKAQIGYVDVDDTFVVQKVGDTELKNLEAQDIFGGWIGVDIPLVTARADIPASIPTLTAFGPTGTILQLVFGIGDTVIFLLQLPHSIKPGDTIYPHIHWVTDGVNTNTVKWELLVSTAIIDSNPAFSAEVSSIMEAAGIATAWAHQVTEGDVTFTAEAPGTIYACLLRRITNGGTDNTDAVFGLSVDFYCPTQLMASKNRTSPHYT